MPGSVTRCGCSRSAGAFAGGGDGAGGDGHGPARAGPLRRGARAARCGARAVRAGRRPRCPGPRAVRHRVCAPRAGRGAHTRRGSRWSGRWRAGRLCGCRWARTVWDLAEVWAAAGDGSRARSARSEAMALFAELDRREARERGGDGAEAEAGTGTAGSEAGAPCGGRGGAGPGRPRSPPCRSDCPWDAGRGGVARRSAAAGRCAARRRQGPDGRPGPAPVPPHHCRHPSLRC